MTSKVEELTTQLLEALKDNPDETKALATALAEGVAPAGGMQSTDEILEDGSPAYDIEVYDRVTGVSSTIKYYMKERVLKKRYTYGPHKGEMAFSEEQLVEPKVGTIKCRLHPDSTEREYFNELGMFDRVCLKSNLRSNLDREQHMRIRHQQEFRTFNEDKDEIERVAERKFRDKQTELMNLQTNELAVRQAPRCSGTTAEGNPFSRPPEGDSETCFQHS